MELARMQGETATKATTLQGARNVLRVGGHSNLRASSMSVQEVCAIKRIALYRLEAGIANHAAQLFLGGAIVHAGGAHHVFFQHDRANVIAAKSQTQLADLQSLCYPA